MRYLAILLLTSCVLSVFSADQSVPVVAPVVVTDPATVTVFSTDKGAKYHVKGCPAGKLELTLAQALTDGDTPCGKCNPPVYDPAKIPVSVSDNGKKYHLKTCRFSKTETTLTEAIAKGLEPCAQCKPPVVWKPASAVK